MQLNNITLALLALAAPALAGEMGSRICTNSSLRGEYGFAAQGTTLAALHLPAPLTGPFASSGLADFDGNGHFTLTATSSFNGVVQGPATVAETYSVNPDCSYTSQAANGVTFRAVIVDRGRELLILQTTPGVVIAGTAESRHKRGEDEQRPSSCSANSISGSYGFLAEGYAGAPTVPGGPFAPLDGVGTVTLMRDGTFSMLAQRSVNGVLDPQPLPLQGTYTLGSGCTFKMTFEVGFHFDGTVVNRDQLVFIETDPGTVLTVKAVRL